MSELASLDLDCQVIRHVQIYFPLAPWCKPQERLAQRDDLAKPRLKTTVKNYAVLWRAYSSCL